MSSFLRYGFSNKNLWETKKYFLFSQNRFIQNSIMSRNYSQIKSVKCKVAVITGGTNGSCFDIADSLLEAGARAIIFGGFQSTDTIEEIETLNRKYGGEKVLFEACDLTNKDEVENLFKMAVKKYKKVEFVVNSAEIDEPIDEAVSININSIVLGTLLGFQYMGIQNGGHGGYIVNVSSILGLQPFFGSPVFTGTKHFILGFTRSMGSDYFYKLTKVKLLTICPSISNTFTSPERAHIPCFSNLGQDMITSLKALPSHQPNEFKQGIFSMIEDGENGSIWVGDGCNFYKANIPDINFCKKIKNISDRDSPPSSSPCKRESSHQNLPKDPCKTSNKKDPQCSNESSLEKKCSMKKKDPKEKISNCSPCKRGGSSRDPCTKE